MQQEELLRKIRLFATIVTVSFVVLIVGLLIQFGLIAHQNTELSRLHRETETLQQQIDEQKELIKYYESDEFKKDQALGQH